MKLFGLILGTLLLLKILGPLLNRGFIVVYLRLERGALFSLHPLLTFIKLLLKVPFDVLLFLNLFTFTFNPELCHVLHKCQFIALWGQLVNLFQLFVHLSLLLTYGCRGSDLLVFDLIFHVDVAEISKELFHVDVIVSVLITIEVV